MSPGINTEKSFSNFGKFLCERNERSEGSKISEGINQIENDDIIMKTKLYISKGSSFGVPMGTLKIDDNSFVNTSRGFTPHCD